MSSASPFRDPLSEQELGELFAAAGARPPVPESPLRAIRGTARAEWERLPKQVALPPSRLRRWAPALLAAAVLIATAIGWQTWRTSGPAAPAAPVAEVELVRGEASLVPSRTASPRDGLVTGRRLAVGSRVETGTAGAGGRVALRLARGGSLRLDRGTSVRLISGSAVELERGAAYFDSGGGAAGEPIEIVTRFGRVRELGTQFEVRLRNGVQGGLSVRVREGSVTVARRGGGEPVAAGEGLLIDDGGSPVRQTIERRGPDWDWVLDSAPPPAIEGRSLRFALDWACRELGWQLAFEDAALDREAATIQLHGTLEALRPAEAVDALLAGAGLGRRIDQGVLQVVRKASGTAE